MKEYNTNILTSIRQAVHEPKPSKYVKKVMGSINKHVGGKQYANIPEYETPLIEESTKQRSDNIESTKNCKIIKEIDCEQLSDSTADSGVITFKEDTIEKCQKRKISFSPEKEIVEIDTDQPKYYDIMPQKVITQLCQTPQPQKPEYKFIYNSTPVQKTEELTEDVLKAANLIRDHYCKPEIVLDLSAVENNFTRSPSGRSVDDKFVVNLFESRQSKRWKRKGVHFPNEDFMIQSFIALESQDNNEPETESQKSQTYLEPFQEEPFQKLKKEKDMECVKMVQASNVLKMIRKNQHKEWSDELLAEKILLETDEKYALLINKIQDLDYAKVKTTEPCHKATVTLSNFEFSLKPQETNHYKPTKYTQFFILTLSHETELLMSKVMVPKDDKIIFQEKFTFTNLTSDFNIIVKIFTINLKTSGRTMCSIFGKKTKNFCPMSKISYENVHTYEMEESSVLKPSFRCCGQFILTKNQIGIAQFTLSQVSSDSQLQQGVIYTYQNDSLNIYANFKGFLTLAMPNKQNEVLLRERKWCVLDGTILSIYNYPSEEDFGCPVFSINLQYCLVRVQKNLKNWSKKRTFLLKAGRPTVFDDENYVSFKKKSDFVVEKYFFIADDNADFKFWTNQLQSILNCLKDWQKLAFPDDYY